MHPSCSSWRAGAVFATISAGFACAAIASVPSALPEGEGVVASPATAESPQPARVLDLPARFGPLKALYRPSPRGGRGRAVLLIGAVGHRREGLDPLASALQEKGYSVLVVENPAMIVRKMGSGRGARILINDQRLNQAGIPDLVEDLQAALRFLEDEPTASSSSIAVVGEGLGANLAAMVGANDPRVVALAYVQPAKECDESLVTRSLSACSDRASLLVAGEDKVFKTFFQASSDPDLTLVDPSGPSAVSDPRANDGSASPKSMIPHAEDVLSWLIRHYPPLKP